MGEFDFLFKVKINTDDSSNSIFRNAIPKDNKDGYTVSFKGKGNNTTAKIKEHYKKEIYRYDNDYNPYLNLCKDFQKKDFKQLLIKYADLAYLTDLGAYPLNRLVILRRYPEGSVVPHNLNSWEDPVAPISTVIGWVNPADENMLGGFNFNETWVVQKDMIHTVLQKLVKEEFGMNLDMGAAVPGWSQGILFAFLKSMGIVGDDFGFQNIPMGDPDVLREGATRVTSADAEFGLVSKFSFNLKTSYEQKFIGSVDPGSAMIDIIQNLTKMGTSNTKIIGDPNGEVIKSLLSAINSGPNLEAWWNFISTTISAFIGAIGQLFTAAGDAITGDNKPVDNKDNKEKPKVPTGSESVSLLSASTAALGLNDAYVGVNSGRSFADVVKEGGKGILQSILASTVMKYKWALKGAVASLVGINSTPWHLTIGNPYSPFISVGNIVVDNVDLKFNNELGFNDIPTKLDVDISLRLGRNTGAQEIVQMFNQGYFRVYDKNGKSPNAGRLTNTANNADQTNGPPSATSGLNAGANAGMNPQPTLNTKPTDPGSTPESAKSTEPSSKPVTTPGEK